MLKKHLWAALLACPLFSFAQDGTLDMSFNPTPNPAATEYNGFGYGSTVDGIFQVLKLQSGKLLVYGDFSDYQGIEAHGLAVIDTTGVLDTSFNAGSGPVGNFHFAHPNLLAQQPDGKLIVAGYFDSFSGSAHRRIVRLNLNGSIDESFNAGTAADAGIEAMVLQPDGKILCAGNFALFNAQEAKCMVRLNTDGSIDTTFSIGQGFKVDTVADTEGEVLTLALQPDGKIIVGGHFLSFNGTPVINLLRLTATGSFDSTFTIGVGAGSSTQNANIIGRVSKVLYDAASSKIYICGIIAYFNNAPSYNIKRLNADGAADATFNLSAGIGYNGVDPYAEGFLHEMLLLQDGRLAVGGEFTAGTCQNMVILLPDGTVDTTFNTQIIGDYDEVNSLVETGGGLFVAGDFDAVNYFYNKKKHIVKLQYDGLTDLSFNPNMGCTAAGGFVYGSFGLTDNTILLTPLIQTQYPYGYTEAVYNERPSPTTIRVNPDGSIHTQDYDTFIASGIRGNNFTYDTNGELVVCEEITGANRKITDDGTTDTSFTSSSAVIGTWVGHTYSTATVIQPDGRIVLGGNFVTVDGNLVKRIVRLNADGSYDATFNAGQSFNTTPSETSTGYNSYNVNVLQLQPDGRILAAGDFTNVEPDEPIVNNIVRLNPDGSPDPTFVQGTGFNGPIRALVYQQDGKIMAAGSFTSYNGVAVHYIVRLNNDGSIDTSFVSPYPESDADSNFISLLLQPDGKYIVLGRVGGAMLINRLTTDGTPDSTFFNDNVFELFDDYFGDLLNTKMQLLADQRIMLTGTFHEFNGIRRVGVAVLNNTPTTTLAVPAVTGRVATPVTAAPNPVSNVLNLVATDTITTATVYAPDGRLVTTLTLHNNRGDISALAAGIYLVKVISGGTTQTIKIIKG